MRDLLRLDMLCFIFTCFVKTLFLRSRNCFRICVMSESFVRYTKSLSNLNFHLFSYGNKKPNRRNAHLK